MGGSLDGRGGRGAREGLGERRVTRMPHNQKLDSSNIKHEGPPSVATLLQLQFAKWVVCQARALLNLPRSFGTRPLETPHLRGRPDYGFIDLHAQKHSVRTKDTAPSRMNTDCQLVGRHLLGGHPIHAGYRRFQEIQGR